MKRHPEHELWLAEAGKLSAADEKWLAHHVADCVACDDRLAAVRLARVVLDEAQAAEPRVDWARVDAGIERFVDSKRRGLRRWPALVALGTLVAAGAGVVAVAQWSAVEPPKAAEVPVAAVVGPEPMPALRAGAQLVLGLAQKSVALPDGSTVSASREALVRVVAASPQAIELDVEQGQVDITAAHVARRHFIVRAGAATVRVVGTVFSVQLSGGRTQVDVSNGAVRVEASGQSWLVKAGDRLVVPIGNVKRVRRSVGQDAAPVVRAEPTIVPAAAGSLPRLSPAASAARRTPPVSTTQVKDIETLFLDRAEASLEKGGCDRFQLGLEDIANDGPRTERSERARFVLARCFEVQLRPRKAFAEFRKYLDEYPQGRSVAEARKALGE